VKLIVLSDLHLMVPEEAAHDLSNHARLRAAINRVNGAYADADLVVLAGDLADRGRYAQSYEDLKSAIADFVPPVAVTVGNHDHRDVFLDVFGPEAADENGFVQSSHILDGHHVIVLDSLEKNTDPTIPYYSARTGHICPKRIEWLSAKLEAARGAPVIIVLHHPVLPVGIQMDPWGLRDTGPLIDLLVDHGDVRQVISGHIHMPTTSIHRGIAFTTIAGGHSTSVEDFGTLENKYRRVGPAQMAVVLSDQKTTTLHFDNYVDHHAKVTRR